MHIPNLKMHKSARGPVFGTEMSFADIAPWRPTVQQIRDAALEHRVAGPSVPNTLAAAHAPSQRETETISDMVHEAIIAGRLIEFGELPNAVIKEGGNRGGPLYTFGGLVMPFSQCWLLRHTWDSEQSESIVALYLINPLTDTLAGGDFEAVELEPMIASGTPVLVIGDRGLLTPDQENERRYNTYCCRISPSIWRFLPECAAQLNNGGKPENAAAGNLFDPIMAGLMILNTTGVARETVRVNEKLQRARVKSGKPRIPPFDRVDSLPYVTALTAKRSAVRGAAQGGQHASPVPHLRRGHLREYASGKRSIIRDTLVRVTPEARAAFLSQRSHYAVQP